MLAQAAGVSKALLFHHFGSKKQLYLDVLARYMQQAKESVAAAPFEEYAALDFFTAREQFSINKYLFNRRHPAGYKLMMDAFFRTPEEVREEIYALEETVTEQRRQTWRRLFESVRLVDGVAREEAFELVMMVIDAFDQMFLEEISFEKEPDDAQVERFLEKRNRFLSMVRSGIEKRRDGDDA